MNDLHQRYLALPPSPKELGTVQQLAIRPQPCAHQAMKQLELDPENGIKGDRWINGSWISLPDGSPDPRLQVSITNSHIIRMIAGSLEAGLECGDNLFVDFDLSEANLPIGSRLKVGNATLEVSDIINDACGKFIQRFGKAPFDWIRSPGNAPLRLRGLFCRIVSSGSIQIGAPIQKL